MMTPSQITGGKVNREGKVRDSEGERETERD